MKRENRHFHNLGGVRTSNQDEFTEEQVERRIIITEAPKSNYRRVKEGVERIMGGTVIDLEVRRIWNC